MNELKGQKIRIVLNLKQGRGFGLIGLENIAGITGLFIEATLNGSSLATDVFPIINEPSFDSELMWESDRKSLRRLRTDIATVRVQCFATDEQQLKKERIGQFIINIRQAHIVPSGKPNVINERWWTWHKLAGGKSPIPEVLCSLRLEERPRTPDLSVSAENNITFGSQSQHNEQPSLPATKYHPESKILNIGPEDTKTNTFLLTIQCTAAENLEGLLSRYLSKEQISKEKGHFSYKILEQEIKSPTLHLRDISTEQLHEDISITVHSTLINLHHCLEKSPKLFVKLKADEADLASGEIDLKTLRPTMDLKTCFTANNENSTSVKEVCYLQESLAHDFGKEPRPHIKISVTLKSVNGENGCLPNAKSSTSTLSSESKNLEAPEGNTKVMDHNIPLVRSDTYILDDRTKTSEFDKEGARLVRSTTYTILDTPLPVESKDVSTMQNIFIPKPPNDDKSTQTLLEDHPHLYVLDIALTDVTFHQFPLNQNISFRFRHPKVNLLNEDSAAISVSELNREIALYNISCKYRFVATPQNIGRLLKAHPPTISVCYTIVDKLQDMAHATLDTGPLLVDYKQMRSYYKTLLVDVNSMIEIGILGVQMHLHDEGLYKETEEAPESIHEKDLGPPVLDDCLAYKIIEELEKWKEQQKKLYEMQLKKKEDAHLAALTAEWRKRRSELESNLIQKKEEFAIVAQDLKDATEEIRLNMFHNKEREIELKKLKAMLFQKQKAKLKQLSEPLKDLEAGLGSKMGMIENNMQKLQDTISKLEQENAKLRETLALQDEELDKMRKTALTKDQTASLLQELKSIEEKLENALKSKAFFKEQWAKAVREIHHIKSEHQKIIQTQVRKNMEALQKFGVQHLLESDSSLPQTQTSGLDMLRNINAMKNNGIGDSNEHIKEFVPTPHRIRGSQSMHSLHTAKSFSIPSKEHSNIEAKLKALVEERDSLLQTGTYTLEDPVVYKLNNEIRSLLIHSNGVT